MKKKKIIKNKKKSSIYGDINDGEVTEELDEELEEIHQEEQP